MNLVTKRKILFLVTRDILFGRGYSLPDGYEIEWDAKEPDSQYSYVYEDVEHMLESLRRHGYEIVEKPKVVT